MAFLLGDRLLVALVIVRKYGTLLNGPSLVQGFEQHFSETVQSDLLWDSFFSSLLNVLWGMDGKTPCWAIPLFFLDYLTSIICPLKN